MREDEPVWRNPAPDASVPMVATGWSGVATTALRLPTVIPNPLEAHLTAIREAYQKLDQQHGLTSVVISGLRAEIVALTRKCEDAEKRCAEAEAKLERIRGHL